MKMLFGYDDPMQTIVPGISRSLFLLTAVLCATCAGEPPDVEVQKDVWVKQRAAMVRLLRLYGIKDEQILAAMSKVPRHMYIPEKFRRFANSYGNHPCPIGHGQTISQPFIVAHMTERMGLKKDEKVLEIGTGSGYQAAILAELGVEVYSIEIIPELAEHARKALASEGYKDVHVLTGDGYKGWSEHAPFDAIIITCAPEEVPKVLVGQLKDGGRMILPLGTDYQQLVILRKKGNEVHQESDMAVRFVPMVHGKEKESKEEDPTPQKQKNE